ncbi:MAG: hypothetical protein EOP06_31510, partial [Proteobacteria bacterium]
MERNLKEPEMGVRKQLVVLIAGALVTANFCVLEARAADGVSFRIHHQYQSMRALGMGDAFVAVANDYSALFYNPAGLARRTDGEVNLSLDVGATPKIQDISNQFKDAQNSSTNESAKQQAIIDVINKNAGNTYGLRVMGPSGVWVRPNWGMAVLPADVSVQMDLHNQVGPAINATVFADTTIAYGYARDFDWLPDSRLSLGITGKVINRGYFSRPVTAMEAAVNSSIVSQDDLLEGYTVDADIGTLWTPNIPAEGILSWLALAKPTFGAVIRNVGEVGFGQSFKLLNKQKTSAPEKNYRVLD